MILAAVLLVTGCGDDSDTVVDTTITYTVVQQQGVMNKKDTVSLYLEFSKVMARTSQGGMALDDIVITGAGGEAVKTGTWSQGTQPSRTVNIDILEQGEIKVAVNFSGVAAEEKTVFVCKKLGFRPDANVTVNDIVHLDDLAGAGNTVAFGRYDGDPAAVLAPGTYDPITHSSQIGLEHVIAVFDPPLDLHNSSDGVLRWFDMIWEGFGSSWVFDDASGGPEIPARPGVNPTTSWALHNVVFQLELLVDNGGADGIVVYEAKSETNTSTGAKRPVRFDTVNTSGGSLPWGTGYNVKKMTLRVTDVQLRTGPPVNESEALANKDWRALSASRNAHFTDLYITSLTVDFAVPPPPVVLFDASGTPQWHSGITSASFGVRGDVEVAHAVTDAMANPISKTDPDDQMQMVIKWDPPYNAASPTSVPYTSIKFSYAEDDPAGIDFANWYGYGTFVANTGGAAITYTKNYGDDGSGGVPASVAIPLLSEKYSSTDVTKLVGILIQGGGKFTVTKIWIE